MVKKSDLGILVLNESRGIWGKICKYCCIDILVFENVLRYSFNNIMKFLYY